MTCGVQLPPTPQIKAAFTINCICNTSAVGSQLNQPRNGSIHVVAGTAALRSTRALLQSADGVPGLSLSLAGDNPGGGGEEVTQLPGNISASLRRATWKGGGKGLKQLVPTPGFPRAPWV